MGENYLAVGKLPLGTPQVEAALVLGGKRWLAAEHCAFGTVARHWEQTEEVDGVGWCAAAAASYPGFDNCGWALLVFEEYLGTGWM